MRFLALFFCVFLFGCLEPRLEKFAGADKFFTHKIVTTAPPAWAKHYGDMPQFSDEEQKQIVAWLTQGKIETKSADQHKDFEFINSLDQLLATGEKDDVLKVSYAVQVASLSDMVPTQFELYWGNVAPKIIDTLSSVSEFSACDGSVLTATDKSRYYILDGHHRWAGCMFVRRFLGKAEEFKTAFGPLKTYEERKIYSLLKEPATRKLQKIPELKITVIEGDPQGISRAFYELAKLGHGHFDLSGYAAIQKNPVQYLRTTIFWENTLWQWCLFAASIAFALLLSKLLLWMLHFKARSGDASRKRVAVLNAIVQTLKKYIYSVAFLISINLALPLLTLPAKILQSIHTGISIAVIWLLTIFAARLFMNFMHTWRERVRTHSEDGELAHLFPLLTKFGTALIYFSGILFVFNEIGYNIYSAIAGLGVGGFALAMAGRETVGHIFAGISLYVDKVVKEGDYLLLDAPMRTWGRVERVGLRSTTIRTKYNTIVVMPNSLLANFAVNNVTQGGHKRLYRNKILLAQDTQHTKVLSAIQAIRTIIENTEHAQDVEVHFMKYEAFGFYIRIQFFVDPYKVYHDTVSKVNLAVLEYLNTNQIRLAVDFENLKVPAKTR